MRRASFTWWVTIVQLICFIVTISIYGVATIGGFTTTIRDEVVTYWYTGWRKKNPVVVRH